MSLQNVRVAAALFGRTMPMSLINLLLNLIKHGLRRPALIALLHHAIAALIADLILRLLHL